MPGKVRVEFDVQSQKGLAEFDKLNKKQQMTVVQGSKIGKEFEKVEKKARRTAKAGTSAFGDITKGIISGIGAMQVFNKIVSAGQQELELLKKRQQDVFERQKTVATSIGKFISDTGANKEQVKRVTGFSQSEALRTGLNQEDIITGVTTAISKAGTQFTEKQIFGSVSKAADQRRVNQDLDIGEVSQALLRLQKLGFTLKQAGNFTAGFGPQFGGKFSDILPEVGGLIQQAEGTRQFEQGRYGKGITTQEDVFALTGLISQQLGEDAATTTTIVKNLFSRINLAQKGGKGFDFKTEGSLNRIVELAKSFRANEIRDDELIKLFTSAGLKGSKAVSALTAISTGEGDLNRRRGELRGGFTGKRDITAEQLTTFQSVEQVANILKNEREKQKTSISKFTNIEAARKATVTGDIASTRERTGVSESLYFKLEQALFNFGALSEERLKETALKGGASFPARFGGLFIDKEAQKARREQNDLLNELVRLQRIGLTRKEAFEKLEEKSQRVSPKAGGQGEVE